MTKTTRNDRSSEPSCRLLPSMPEAFDDLRMSVDRFCLLAGLESLNEMMSAWTCPELVESRSVCICHRGLELDGRDVAECGMSSRRIVEPVDVTVNRFFGLSSGQEAGPPDEL